MYTHYVILMQTRSAAANIAIYDVRKRGSDNDRRDNRKREGQPSCRQKLKPMWGITLCRLPMPNARYQPRAVGYVVGKCGTSVLRA